MNSQLNCPLCQEEYNDQNPPRLLIRCGHTFCEKCLKKIITQKKGNFKLVCPEDGEMVTLKDNTMANFPKNIALMKIIQSSKQSILQFKDPDVSKIVKTQQNQQDQDTRDLVSAIYSPNNTQSQDNIKVEVSELKQQKQVKQQKQQKKIEQQKKVSPKQQKQKQQQNKQIQKKQTKQLCKIHQKPLQIVCIIDLKKICANCAIFGEHKGHDFKSIEQIEKQRVVYYQSILGIMEKKETVAQRISSQQTCSSIMQILMKKKQNMRKLITQKYQKLISTIQAKQKQSLKNLQSVILKTQSKLKNLMKIDPNIVQKYDNWQEKSYKQIKILQGNNFQAKLTLLFVVSQNQVDVLEQGDNIIQMMYKQQENLINQVQLALENIGVDFNLQIFNHIDGFVQLYDEAKKKKSKGRTNKLQSQSNQNQNASPPASKLTGNNNQAKFSSIKKQEQISSMPKKQEQQKKVPIQTKYQKIQQKHNFLHHQQSLLDEVEVKKVEVQQYSNVKQQTFEPSVKKVPQQNKVPQLGLSISQKNIQQILNQFKQFQKHQEQTKKKIPQELTQRSNKKDSSFSYQKTQKSNKKKLLSKIKVPQKYQKMLEGTANDQVQTVDFTNAQLGDATVIQICQLISGTKAKTVKLIRNKINDDTVQKIIPHLGGVISLNLSQNFLTQRVLDILYNGKQYLNSIKTIILCQNKIIERKHKAKIDKLKNLDITISI